MRILHVVHQFLPEYTGGTEQYVADLSRRLCDGGHDVAIFTGGNNPGRHDWQGIPVTVVPGGLRGPRGAVSLFASSFGNRGIEAGFTSLLQDFRPDVVHFHHLIGLSTRLPRIARESSAAACFTLHDYWFICPKSQLINHAGAPCSGPVLGLNCGQCAAERLGKPYLQAGAPAVAPVFVLRQRRVRRAFSEVDLLLAPSQFVADFAIRAGLPRDRIERVDFGIPTLALPPRSAALKVMDAPLRVLFLGAVSWSKGVHVLAEACRLLDPTKVDVRIMGDLNAYPEYSAPLMDTARELPLRFEGQASRAEVAAALASSDVLVIPSLWYENAPLVISEAFAAGAPVVASNIGALAEKVRDGVDGLLFPPGDAPALAAVIARLAIDRPLLQQLRDGIRQGVTREQHVNQMMQIYERLCAPRRPAGQVAP